MQGDSAFNPELSKIVLHHRNGIPAIHIIVYGEHLMIWLVRRTTEPRLIPVHHCHNHWKAIIQYGVIHQLIHFSNRFPRGRETLLRELINFIGVAGGIIHHEDLVVEVGVIIPTSTIFKRLIILVVHDRVHHRCEGCRYLILAILTRAHDYIAIA